METKNSKRFGLFCLLMLLVAGVQAQPSTWKYPKVESGRTIVSRDAAGGIKSDALLTEAHIIFLRDQSTQPIYTQMEEYNMVSAKFQVASANASTGSTTWADAYAQCKSYSTDGYSGLWRLPTQKELMLIWMFKTQLTGCGLTSSSGNFWSGTGSSSSTSNAWYVNFANGSTSSNVAKEDTNQHVRCVRDL